MEVVKPMRAARKMGYIDCSVQGVLPPGTDYLALTNCPRSVLRYSKDSKAHPFAKPIALLEYLIRTFTNDDDVVLDPTMGSGSAGVAALSTGRKFVGAENGIDQKGRCIFTIAKDRIASHSVANDNAKTSKPRRKVKPVVKPARPLKPEVQPDDVPPLPNIIPAF